MSREEVDFSLRLALQNGEPLDTLFTRDEVDAFGTRVTEAATRLEESRDQAPLSFLALPYAYSEEHGPTCFDSTFWDTLATIHATADRIRNARGHFLHLGIGGSALGAITLVDALGMGNGVGYDCPAKIHISDNVDPDSLGRILHCLELRNTYVNVVTKSGNTVETIANFAVLWDLLRSESGLASEELRKRIYVTTNPDEGALADLAHAEGFTLLPLPGALHGRFSVLSPAGLFAAAVAGVDIEQLLQGAREADRKTAEAPFWENPAQQFAALHCLGQQKGISNLILFPYSNRLQKVADWYSQLVAESLGKQGQGLTPVKALGVTDQHSQLQLYNDGPKDKLVVFFSISRHAETLRIPELIASNPEFAYLANKSFGDLMRAEREATEVSLHLHGVPSCRFNLGVLNAFNMGYLLMTLQKTVCILGALSGVNAFDQPAVEESKEYARAMLGKTGEQYDRLRDTVARLSK